MNDKERRDQAHGNFEQLSARIEEEYQLASSLKAAGEARSGGLFALNLGVLTLFLAIQAQLRFPAAMETDWYFGILWGSFIAIGLSLLATIVAVWPVRHHVLSMPLLRKAYFHAKAADTVLLPDLIPERLDALERMRRLTVCRSVVAVIALILSAASVVGFALVVIGSVTAP